MNNDSPYLFHNFIDRIADYLPQLLAVMPVVLLIVVGTFVIDAVMGRMLVVVAHRLSMEGSDLLPVRRLLRIVIRILALIIILSIFGFQLGGIWAAVSTVLGLIAIGFVAVWSMLSNTTATVMILFLRPFQIGDDVEFVGEAVRGRVVDLNFFFTTLIDHEGSLVQIPNNLFWQKTLKRRRNEPTISLPFQLNSPTPANVALPPPPPPAAPARPPAEDPLMMVPDMRTISPPARPSK